MFKFSYYPEPLKKNSIKKTKTGEERTSQPIIRSSYWPTTVVLVVYVAMAIICVVQGSFWLPFVASHRNQSTSFVSQMQ